MHKQLTRSEIDSDNMRLFVEKPDKHFSAKRNYAIIDQVIKENEQMQVKLQKEVQENAGNVADILASFAKYKLDEGKPKQLEEWLGKEHMKKLYGDRLMDKLRMIEIIRAKNLRNGNTLYGGNFYLR